MTVAVLDASALLALLLGEPGSEKVRAVLAASALTVVNLGEVVGHFARNPRSPWPDVIRPPTSSKAALSTADKA
jgi:PIN domain nuclease of toxin-antitoxin system